jgi:hypothetical protein
MVPNLSEKDQMVLMKLAPELADPVCPGSGHECFSILPPVLYHFSASDRDFIGRIRRLTREELEYPVGLIRDGGESPGCIRPEHIAFFAEEVADKFSVDIAERVIGTYTAEGSCIE